MTGKHHLVSGVVAGICCATSIMMGNENGLGSDLIVACGSLVAASIGSLVPDLDTKTSKLGKKMKITSTIASKLFGHRGFLHSPLFVVCIFILGALLFKKINATDFSPIYYSFALGMLNHLACDMTTKGGIPLLYPFTRVKFSLSPMKSGSKWEPVMLIIMCLLSIGLTILFISNGTFF
jgi:inner membrane protein